MRYAICYDAANDRLRERIAKTLEGYGERVQFSVFECVLDARQRTALVGELRGLLTGAEEVNIRVYRLCADCRKASFGLGDLTEPFDAKPWIVI